MTTWRTPSIMNKRSGGPGGTTRQAAKGGGRLWGSSTMPRADMGERRAHLSRPPTAFSSASANAASGPRVRAGKANPALDFGIASILGSGVCRDKPDWRAPECGNGTHRGNLVCEPFGRSCLRNPVSLSCGKKTRNVRHPNRPRERTGRVTENGESRASDPSDGSVRAATGPRNRVPAWSRRVARNPTGGGVSDRVRT